MPNLPPHGLSHGAFGGDPAPSMLTPDLGIELMDHFIETTSSTPTGNLAQWNVLTNSGTAAVDNTQALQPQYNVHGVISFISGGSGSRIVFILAVGSTAGYGFLSLGQGPLVMMWRVRLATWDPPADCSTLRLGLYMDDGAGNPQNGIYAQYDPSVSPYWCAANLKATVLTTDTSGLVSGTTDNFVWVKMTINAAWTSATVRVNGQNAGTIAISSAATFVRAPIAMVFQKKAGSTATNQIYLDAFYMRYLWNAPQPS